MSGTAIHLDSGAMHGIHWCSPQSGNPDHDSVISRPQRTRFTFLSTFDEVFLRLVTPTACTCLRLAHHIMMGFI
jgi:hypothetical protein